MRIRTYCLILLFLTAPVAGAALAALHLAFQNTDELRLPGWTLFPFMLGLLLPVGFGFVLKIRKTKFLMPVPDPENPGPTRFSRRVTLVVAAYAVSGIGCLSWFLVQYARFDGTKTAAIFAIPAITIAFTVWPWVRTLMWCRASEDIMIRKYSEEEPAE